MTSLSQNDPNFGNMVLHQLAPQSLGLLLYLNTCNFGYYRMLKILSVYSLPQFQNPTLVQRLLRVLLGEGWYQKQNNSKCQLELLLLELLLLTINAHNPRTFHMETSNSSPHKSIALPICRLALLYEDLGSCAITHMFNCSRHSHDCYDLGWYTK